MLRVGLTGGIGTGKSHVLRRLAAAGCHTLDLDQVAHETLAPGGSAFDEVLAAFGRGVLTADGTIDRRLLGARVFSDGDARARLNAIVHPKVRAEEARRVAAFRVEPEAVVITDAALLVEAGVHLRFDRLVVTFCSPEEQLLRLVRRDRIDAAAARARLAAQMPGEEKRRFAHFALDTSGSVEETHRQADALAETLAVCARLPRTRVRRERLAAAGCLLEGPQAGPRGLTPAGLLSRLLHGDAPEMELLAGDLSPPASGPWYRAARPQEDGPRPETLAGALALGWLARRGSDPDSLLAAAYSLARLTHLDPEPIADACLLALLFLEVATNGLNAAAAERLPGLARRAGRWVGREPTARAGATLAAALAHPRDAPAARRLAAPSGHSDLAAALVGLNVGPAGGHVPAPLAGLVERL